MPDSYSEISSAIETLDTAGDCFPHDYEAGMQWLLAARNQLKGCIDRMDADAITMAEYYAAGNVAA